MERLRAICLSLVVLAGCSVPSPSDIEASFWSNRELFESLALMIDADGSAHTYTTIGSFGIGADRIGEYWPDSSRRGHWSYPATSRAVPRSEALATSGLDESRLEQYMQALKQIGAKRLEYYHGQIRFLMHRQGIAVSGCTIWIHYLGEDSGTEPSALTTLEGQWQLEDQCT